MTTDRTTKLLLAVIALALSVIAARDLGLVGSAAAGFGEGQKVIVTNYQTNRNGFGQLLFVHCTNCK